MGTFISVCRVVHNYTQTYSRSIVLLDYSMNTWCADEAMEDIACQRSLSLQFRGPDMSLRALNSSGCTALTGVETMSNGVQALQLPEAKNASVTLLWMAFSLGILFLGTSFLADHFGITPKGGETVVSQLAREIFGGGSSIAALY
jgi:hypothetical protein